MRKIKTSGFKRTLSSFLAAAISLTVFTAIPISAEDYSSATHKTIYTYDGYSVEYSVTNAWEGSQTVELTISNIGDESILNWALKYDAEGEISGLYNASVYEQNNTEYVIKNAGWNYEIAPNQSVMYGYTLNNIDFSIPNSFEIYSKRVDIYDGYDVQYNITNEWATGVQGDIIITNTSNAPP